MNVIFFNSIIFKVYLFVFIKNVIGFKKLYKKKRFFYAKNCIKLITVQ